MKCIHAFVSEKEKSGNYCSPADSQSLWSQNRLFIDDLGEKARTKEGREGGREEGRQFSSSPEGSILFVNVGNENHSRS